MDEVSFDVGRGEVVGIIGKNGAGKSTLLKVLSRITAPTAGYVDIFGRVSSLLEVGTGFHGELTGRENVYLNGAMLGMRKREIDRKFDAIVAFSEVEKFLDTPVKHYSSGMYVRLAFAVAAHLEPEILIVDEVLAVGDVRFQQKCLQKMEEVGRSGRTVLFVSHSMQSITRLCPRVILLDKGKILHDGTSYEAVSAYMSSGLGTSGAHEWPRAEEAPGDDVARLRAVRVRTEAEGATDTIDIRQRVGIVMEYEILQPGHVLFAHLQLYNQEGVHIFSAHDLDPEWRLRPRPAGRYSSTAWVPGNFFSEGTIFVGAGLSTINEVPRIDHFYEQNAVAFHVVEGNEGDAARGDYNGRMYGLIRPMLQWQTRLHRSGACGTSGLDA